MLHIIDLFWSSPALTASFAACTEILPFAAIVTASLTASLTTSPSSPSTTRLTSPHVSASLAEKNRPVKISSMARDFPIARVRRWVPPAPGMTPSVISGSPNLAFGDARIISHLQNLVTKDIGEEIRHLRTSWLVHTHPQAFQRSAARNAALSNKSTHRVPTDCCNHWLPHLRYSCPIVQKVSLIHIWNWNEKILGFHTQRRHAYHSQFLSFISFMSAPAGEYCLRQVPHRACRNVDVPANALSDPVNTTAPIPVSFSASSNALLISSKSGVLSALSASGLFSVMIETEGSGCEVTIWV